MKADDSLGRAVDEFFDLVEAGDSPSPFAYAESLGSSFSDFLRAVEAKSALEAVIEPAAFVEPPEQLGPYTLGRKLGRGGGGTVYEARDERSGKRVALKLVHAALSDQIHIRRFEREGRIGARVRHGHLVEIHEAGSAGDRLYCAMQLVEGPTLKQRLETGPLEPTREQIEQFAGIADGLAAIHREGTLHRDVKPSNILIDAEGCYLLGDFGLVRNAFETSITQSGVAVGTIGYMSPEQLRGDTDTVDARTDVYAFGATLYEAFCGSPVREGATLSVLLRAARDHVPPDPRSIRPELPPALRDVIMTALERRPEDRYQTMEALRDDLQQLAAGGAVAGRPVPALQRWVRRRRRAVLAALALVVGLGAYGVHLAIRPAIVSIECHPAAAVRIDGELRGRTPLRLELEPGAYDVELVLEDFVRRKVRLTLARGFNPLQFYLLIPEDETDYESMRKLEEARGYSLDKTELGSDRGVGELPLGRALLPTGPCRRSDLDTLRFESSAAQPFPLPAALVVRRGDETLHEQPLAGVDLVAEFEFPADVRRDLRVGDEIVWGVVAESGAEFLTTFQVVAEGAELREALATLDRELSEAPDSISRFLRAHVLLQHRLPVAAYREASRAEEQGVLALAIRLRALRALEADGSRLGDRLRDEVAALPVAQQRDWFR